MVLIGCGEKIGPRSPTDAIDRLERKSFFVRLEGSNREVEMSYLRSGSEGGRRVIFLHGTPGSAKDWADFLLDVPSGYEFISLDRLGFGKSEAEPFVAFDDHVAAMAPLFRADPAGGKPILVGHSMGGTLAALAAIDHQPLLGGILIAGGALDPELEDVLWIQKLAEALDFMLPDFLDHANKELIAYEEELRKFVHRLPEVRLPVTVVHGTEDRQVPFANTAFMERSFVGSRRFELIALEGVSHFLPWNSKNVLMDGVLSLAEASSDPIP